MRQTQARGPTSGPQFNYIYNVIFIMYAMYVLCYSITLMWQLCQLTYLGLTKGKQIWHKHMAVAQSDHFVKQSFVEVKSRDSNISLGFFNGLIALTPANKELNNFTCQHSNFFSFLFFLSGTQSSFPNLNKRIRPIYTTWHTVCKLLTS